MNAEIIAIGDEITSGQLLDTNTQWLSTRLESIGVRVLYHSTVGDDLRAMCDVFKIALQRADIIIVTGGLGPTADDLTREAIAFASGCKLEMRDEVAEHIRQMFERRGRVMPESNRVQAFFPRGSRMIDNPHGTAPGIEIAVARQSLAADTAEPKSPSHLFALPGVPAEMRQMYEETVHPRVQEIAGVKRIVLQYKVNCFGAGESQIEAMLPEMIKRGRIPRVGITASSATIILRITAEGEDEAACRLAIRPTVDTIHERLGELIYGYDDEQLQDIIARQLSEQNKTLGIVEWGTAGLINSWMADQLDVSDHYQGGITVHSTASTGKLFGIESPSPASPAATAEQVRVMAERGRELLGTDLCLAVGPFPGLNADSSNGDIPQVEYALAIAGRDTVMQPHPHGGHPALLTILAAKRGLNLVRLELMK